MYQINTIREIQMSGSEISQQGGKSEPWNNFIADYLFAEPSPMTH